jgi:hypothetical protein
MGLTMLATLTGRGDQGGRHGRVSVEHMANTPAKSGKGYARRSGEKVLSVLSRLPGHRHDQG